MPHRKEEKEGNDRDIQLFEMSLRNHKSVLTFERRQNIYIIRHAAGVDIKVFLAMEEILVNIIDYQSSRSREEFESRRSSYTLGQADIIEIMDYLHLDKDIDCIVTLSGYSAYTDEAQEIAEAAGVTLLTAKEFFEGLEARDW